jgi:hypothetical protein
MLRVAMDHCKPAGRKSISGIFFVTDIRTKNITVSSSAIFSERTLEQVNLENIVYEVSESLNVGDKIIATIEKEDEITRIVVKRILARVQPIGSSLEEYLASLRVCIDGKYPYLDFEELNSILKITLGIEVARADSVSDKCNLTLVVDDSDSGTKNCPFSISFNSLSYPMRIGLPNVSEATKKYLKHIYPDGLIDETRVIAFRLIHCLLHMLGYHDHFDSRKIEDFKRIERAFQEGDPAQLPATRVDNFCLCDWEALHFAAIQPELHLHPFDEMICKQCNEKVVLTGISLGDLAQLLASTKQGINAKHLPNLKSIFYVINIKNDGVILSQFPYKSKVVTDLTTISWFGALINAQKTLCNFFIPNRLFVGKEKVRSRDKILLDVELVRELKKDTAESETKLNVAKVAQILKRGTKIVNPHGFLSRIRPFRLGIVLKIGPETELDYVKKVANLVSRLTGWHVEIDTKSSYEKLGLSFNKLDEVSEELKHVQESDRGKFIAKAKEVVRQLAVPSDVEDKFKVNVYVFPEKYTFVQNIFGYVALGEALYRTFAVVSIFPKKQSMNQKLCRDCDHWPEWRFSEAITAIFVIHEVMHIASGLSDHVECSVCEYGREEMQLFRKYCCEDCIREGNNQTKRNCLMSYDCEACIAVKCVNSPDVTLSQFLCEECKKRLFSEDEFAVRQAARMNALIYYKLLVPELIGHMNLSRN